MRAKWEASQAKVKALTKGATARAEAEKVGKEEFEAGFLQGYVDLKRMVALDYPDWDLSTYRGTGLDFWIEEPIGEAPLSALHISIREEVGGIDEVTTDSVTREVLKACCSLDF